MCEEGVGTSAARTPITAMHGDGGKQEKLSRGLSHRPGGSYRRRVLVDVGAVRQVDEDGVHVLDICDDDGQVGQGGQRPGLVLILRRQKYTALR